MLYPHCPFSTVPSLALALILALILTLILALSLALALSPVMALALVLALALALVLVLTAASSPKEPLELLVVRLGVRHTHTEQSLHVPGTREMRR